MKLIIVLLMVACFVTFMTCVIWRMVLYETEVFRVLSKHGRPAYWVFGNAQDRQIREYRAICEEQGYSPKPYQKFIRCYRVAVGAWVACLLLMAVLALVER